MLAQTGAIVKQVGEFNKTKPNQLETQRLNKQEQKEITGMLYATTKMLYDAMLCFAFQIVQKHY